MGKHVCVAQASVHNASPKCFSAQPWEVCPEAPLVYYLLSVANGEVEEPRLIQNAHCRIVNNWNMQMI